MSAGEFRRDRAMEARIARHLEDDGMAPAAVAAITAAHRLAMTPRLERIPDAHHPEFLHPGRCVLILVLDTAFRDPAGLAAAALVESERPALRVAPAAIAAELGEGVAGMVAQVPLEGDDLVEALVTAPEEIRLIALADRLDHCRHAKFWSERAAQRRILEQAQHVFGPVAERTDAALARRFRHWTSAFERALARPV